MKEIKLYNEGKEDNLKSVYDEIIDRVAEVPFGNSDFQNQNTIINGGKTPHRSFRDASLRILDRMEALSESRNTIKRNNIQIQRIERKIKRLEENKPEDYDLDIQELELEVYEIQSKEHYTKKLIKDAVAEIESFLPFFNKIGTIDRKTFESMEAGHFTKRFIDGAAGKSDHIKGLENMGFKTNEKGELYKTDDTLLNNILTGKENILHLDQSTS